MMQNLPPKTWSEEPRRKRWGFFQGKSPTGAQLPRGQQPSNPRLRQSLQDCSAITGFAGNCLFFPATSDSRLLTVGHFLAFSHELNMTGGSS